MEDLGDPPTTAYWLAWATAFLLIIAVVSAGVMNLTDGSSDAGVVSAAGRTSGTPEVATTTTSSTVPPAPTTTARRPAATTSTTLPKAASAVLRAIGTTAPPTTVAPVTTTTAPPVTTTPTTTPATTTTTTLPPRATVTVANEYSRAFVITVNGRTFTLDPNSEAQPVQLDVPPNVNDVIEGHVVADPLCQVGGVGDLFQAGGRYRVAVVTGPNTCGDFASVELRVTSI